MVKIDSIVNCPIGNRIDYRFEGTGVTSLFHSRVLKAFPRPLRPRKMDKFLFLGTHTKIRHSKRIMPKIYLRGKDIHSDRHETNYIARIHVVYLKEADSLLLSWYTPSSSPSPFSPRSTETKCRTGANSSSRKIGLTKSGSLTNTNLI
ncbi:hypothetical protein HAX54_027142 [Datura stramonium]|uniref:Uncharacterized protein n=1 Tax=Datura stramonium TaxID=4076 RepID=A0ABS8V443_DATST|nr:hypothetical protein [Datura stramonium]